MSLQETCINNVRSAHGSSKPRRVISFCTKPALHINRSARGLRHSPTCIVALGSKMSPKVVRSIPMEVQAVLSELTEGQGPFVSAAAWVVVVGATVASCWLMLKAFLEAKEAIERREEGERKKQQEDDAKEADRKAKIKQMFERL